MPCKSSAALPRTNFRKRMSRRKSVGRADRGKTNVTRCWRRAKLDKPENARPPDALIEAELEKNQSIFQLNQQIANLETLLANERE